MEDVRYLERLREKQKKALKRIPEVFYNDMLVAFYDIDRVALGFTVDPIPGRESLKVVPLKQGWHCVFVLKPKLLFFAHLALKYEVELNATISVAESSSSPSGQGRRARQGVITSFMRQTGGYASTCAALRCEFPHPMQT